MIKYPNAKINIGLNLVSKRKDGFHNIETVFFPIGLSDILEINKSKKFTFKNTGLKIDSVENDNLCVKTYNILKKRYNIPEINIHLHKIIPFGAGLGGGSSDAAYTISIINELFNLEISNPEQKKIASSIGSDCAFFLNNKPLFAYDKGDKFKTVNIDLSGFYLVLIFPGININTANAYNGITPEKAKFDLRTISSLNISDWKYYIKNDFEQIVFEQYPEIKEIKQVLYDKGAIYASMSGSGSSIYGFFSHNIEIKNVFPNYFSYKELI